MPKPLLAVIFDHDGTLVDSEPVHHRCWQEAIAPYGAHFALHDYVTHLTGIPSASSAQWIIDRFNLPIDAQALYAQKQKHVDTFLRSDAFPLMPNAEELVRFCFEHGLKLAVASGAGKKEITHSLSAHGLDRWIDVVASKNDVASNKPAPDVYLLALQRLGINAAHAIAVEDSNAGEASALAAALTCVRLRPSRAHEQVIGVQSLKDAQNWLERHLNN
ncbi:MAG TPA: HAD family phosphatase [Cellvibrionaceae bacterium]